MTEPNRRVLLVCYYFPPLGGAGVNRPLQLYRKLPELGYECDVLTVKPVTYRVYEPELLPTDGPGRIYRSGSRDPQRLMHLLGLRTMSNEAIDRGRTVSNHFFPDSKIGWVRPAVKLGRTIAENRHYLAMISTSPPISAHLVAMRLAEEFKLPWLADFRDLWTALPIEDSYSNDRAREKAKKLLKQIRVRSSAVTAVNTTVGEYVGAARTVTNAYDSELSALWSCPTGTSPFVIGVLGTVNELYPLTPLFELLRMLRKASPKLYDRIRVLHVGSIDRQWLVTELRRFQLEDHVESAGRLDRRTTVERLSKASVFYLATSPEVGAAFSTGRVFTLLPSGRPLLAYGSQKGELAKLIRSTGNGHLFDLSTVESACEWLSKTLECLDDGSMSIELQPRYAEPYSDIAMAKSFASVLDEMVVGG